MSLQYLIKRFGTQKEVAHILGVSPSTVTGWKKTKPPALISFCVTLLQEISLQRIQNETLIKSLERQEKELNYIKNLFKGE